MPTWTLIVLETFGVGLVIAGVSLWSVPAALVVAGVSLVGMGEAHS